jgi:hypothetical protein
MTTHHLTLSFSLGNFFIKNNMTVIPHPPYFSLKHCYFDVIEVIKAESQAVAEALGLVHTRRRELLQG